MNTSVAYLVLEDDQAPYVVRESERPQLQSNGGPSRVQVLSAPPRRNLELLMAEIPPGGSAGSEVQYPHGEECLVCLEGRVAVVCGGHQLVLEAGDSCHYDGRAPHSVVNTGSTSARILIAVTPASFEPVVAERHAATNGVASLNGAKPVNGVTIEAQPLV